MKIIDRYIAKQLIWPIVFCSLMLVFLVIMADVFDYLDEMVKNKTTLAYILKYYALLTPQMFVDTISWACLLATIYVLTSFNYHNELVAMKVAGLEITSIIRPIIFIGFFIGIASFLISDQIVPPASRKAVEILKERIEKNRSKENRGIYENVTHYGGKDRLYYARVFRAKEEKMEDFIVLWLDSDKNVRKKTVAREAVWNGVNWELHHATDYTMEQQGEMLGEPTFQEIAVYPEINETPADFLRSVNEGDLISYRELKEYIEKLKTNGIKISTERVSLQHKLALPWQSLVIMFLCVPFLAKSATRRMIAWNVLACLGCVFMFHITGAVMLALGKAGKLFPILSAWTPYCVFGAAALFTLERANQ